MSKRKNPPSIRRRRPAIRAANHYSAPSLAPDEILCPFCNRILMRDEAQVIIHFNTSHATVLPVDRDRRLRQIFGDQTSTDLASHGIQSSEQSDSASSTYKFASKRRYVVDEFGAVSLLPNNQIPTSYQSPDRPGPTRLSSPAKGTPSRTTKDYSPQSEYTLPEKCLVCGAPVKHLDRHYKKAHKIVYLGSGKVQCLVCHKDMSISSVKSHHCSVPQKQQKARPAGKLAQKPKRSVSTRASVGSKNESQRGEVRFEDDPSESRLDGGRHLGHMSRESGRFGSLPMYDDYSDESDA